jgi:hypothetical protein
MKPDMIEGIDYSFIFPENDDKRVHIKLISGPYKDVVYRYGGVKIEEKNDEGHLLFNYEIVESTVVKPKKLEKDMAFKTYIGDLLVQLMTSNMNQDIIDETGTDDTQKLNLQ